MPGQKETSERTRSDMVILPKRKLRLGEVSTTDRLMKSLPPGAPGHHQSSGAFFTLWLEL